MSNSPKIAPENVNNSKDNRAKDEEPTNYWSFYGLLKQSYLIFKRKVKEFAKSTSHKQLEEKLHPLESCHKACVTKQKEIEKKAIAYRDSAYQYAKESLKSYEVSIDSVQDTINLVKKGKLSDSEVSLQAQDVLNRVQVTTHKSRESTNNAVICIQTCVDPQKTVSMNNHSFSEIQKISGRLEREITNLDETVKQANELVHSSASASADLLKEVSNACYTSQKVVYAAFDAVNLADQKTAQLSAEVVTYDKITANIDKAREALSVGKVQEAWGHYYEAELLGYYLFDKDTLRANAKQILHCNPNKMDNDKKKTILKLLGYAKPDGSWELNREIKTEDVIAARRIVQEHYIDEYTKLGMILRQLQILVCISVLLISGILALLVFVPNYGLSTGSFEATNFFARTFISNNGTAENFTATGVTAKNVIASGNISVGNPYFFIAIGLFGALGGTFSAITTLVRGTEGEVPERLANSWLSLAKPVIGASAAVAIFVFLLGGFISLTQSLSNYLIFALAFAAGFSERLILGAVLSVSGGEKKEK